MAALNQRTLRNARWFYFDRMTSREFEEWLYAERNLEQELGEDIYLALVDIDYRTDAGRRDAKSVIETMYPGKVDGLRNDFSKEVAFDALGERISLESACRELANLESAGASEVPPIFDFFVDALDRGNDIRVLKGDVIAELRKLLSKLQTQTP